MLNNAYGYASQKQREKMVKRPYYRQSAVVFWMVGAMLLLFTAEVVWRTGWLSLLAFTITAVVVVFAIASSVYIAKKYK